MTKLNRKLSILSILMNTLFVLSLILSTPALTYAHGDGDGHSGAHPGVTVRVASFDPETDTYNFTCEIPDAEPGSQVDPRRYYAIDPVPVGHEEFYRSYDPFIVWDLDPIDFDEQVHTEAMYHVYCEVQNYSAPPGEQNMASEFHVDLRTTHNQDKPTIYVLESEGTQATLKCDPPDGVTNYEITWRRRSRVSDETLHEFDNQQIIETGVDLAGSGWDFVCTVKDLDTNTVTKWDMPIEFFESGPAYVPTIEGCIPNEPCYQVSPDGIVPPGTMEVTTNEANVNVYINEVYKGTTNNNGQLTITNIVPGLHNIVFRKEGIQELSTLIPIAAGSTLSRSYDLNEGTTTAQCGNGILEEGEECDSSAPQGYTCTAQCTLEETDTGDGDDGGDGNQDMCFSKVADIPVTCAGGEITQDTTSGCRTIICADEGNSLKVLACDKPTNNNPQYFEMYKQTSTGSNIEICLGETCLVNTQGSSGYAKSENYPYCAEDDNPPECTDNDNDGYAIEGGACGPIDCADNNNAINPGMTEQCNSIDDNCNSQTDENNVCQTGATCGNEIVEEGEQCDDGNTQSGDGCSSSCQTENTGQQCSATVFDPQATCTGSITLDTQQSGCRLVRCEETSNLLEILACNKPGNNDPQYFEMYKKQQTGSGVEICLDDTCLSNSGYAKSENFDMCSDDGGDDSNPTDPICGNGILEEGESCDLGASNGVCPSTCSNTCTTNSCDAETDLELVIAPWFPQGLNVVLQCNAQGFTPTTYTYNFGDGEVQTGTNRADVWHTYSEPGSYTATCTATQGATTQTAQLEFVLVN